MATESHDTARCSQHGAAGAAPARGARTRRRGARTRRRAAPGPASAGATTHLRVRPGGPPMRRFSCGPHAALTAATDAGANVRRPQRHHHEDALIEGGRGRERSTAAGGGIERGAAAGPGSDRHARAGRGCESGAATGRPRGRRAGDRGAVRTRPAGLVAIGILLGALAVGAMSMLLSPEDPPPVRPIELDGPSAADRAEERRERLERRRRAERRERLERRRREARRRAAPRPGRGATGQAPPAAEAPAEPAPPAAAPPPQAPAPARPPAPQAPAPAPAPEPAPAPAPAPAPPPPPPADDDDGGDGDDDDDGGDDD
jgi:hypothetical protein